MILATSSFKGSTPHVTKVFRHTYFQELKRTVPFIVAYCLVVFFLLVMPAVTDLINQNLSTVSEMSSQHNSMNSSIGLLQLPLYQYSFGIGFATLFIFPFLGLILGLLQFSYLTSRRAMDVFGALPIKRETVLGAKVLCGACILYIPLVISYFIIFGVNIAIVGYHEYLLYELFVVLFDSFVLVMIPYCATVLMSTITGTILENIIYPVTLLVAPVMLYGLAMNAFEMSIYGYATSDTPQMVQGLLFPYYAVFNSECGLADNGIAAYLLSLPDELKETTFFSAVQPHLLAIEVWLIVCVGMIVLAVFSMRKRNNERAGIKGASKAMNVLACLFATLIGSLLVLCLFLGGWFAQHEKIFAYVWFFAAILIIFAVYQLITLQSAKAMLKSWPLCAVCVGVGIFFSVLLSTNTFGWYLKLPDQTQIKEVSVSYQGITGTVGDNSMYYDDLYNNVRFDDPKIIDCVYRFQQEALQPESMNADVDDWGYNTIHIKYYMKDGKTILRKYGLRSNAMAKSISKLIEEDEFIKKYHVIFEEDLKRYDMIKVSDPYRTRLTEISLEDIDMEQLQKALQQDVLAETLDDILTPSSKEYGWIQLWDDDASGYEDYRFNEQMSILVKGNYKNTIAYLKQIGLEDEMKPDFSQVTEVALFSQQSNGEISDFSSICYYGNLDMALHLFTKSWTNGITLSEDYESIYAKDSEMLQPNVFTDPKKIESVLKDCYNQHEYNKESCTVYVKGLETVTEMILPNQ